MRQDPRAEFNDAFKTLRESKRTYRVISFAPNPFIRWDVPVGAMIEGYNRYLRCIRIAGTVPEGLPARPRALLELVISKFEDVTTYAKLHEFILGMGPHFQRVVDDPIEIPRFVEDAEAWVQAQFCKDYVVE
jgi:hypothetical protein